jgi:hypothetical protein
VQPFEAPTIELTGERFILLADEIFGDYVGYEAIFVVDFPRAAMGLGWPKEKNHVRCDDVSDLSHRPRDTMKTKKEELRTYHPRDDIRMTRV